MNTTDFCEAVADRFYDLNNSRKISAKQTVLVEAIASTLSHEFNNIADDLRKIRNTLEINSRKPPDPTPKPPDTLLSQASAIKHLDEYCTTYGLKLYSSLTRESTQTKLEIQQLFQTILDQHYPPGSHDNNDYRVDMAALIAKLP